MRLIQIPASGEPPCLKEEFTYPEKTYRNDFVGECSKLVKQSLSNFQNHLCAYCEQELKGVFIEHHLSLSLDENKKHQFSWDNFLAVCSSKIRSKRVVLICSDHRGNRPIKIDPRNQDCINTIYFDDVMIRSTDSIFDKELNDILNLNCVELCILRAAKFKELENTFLEEAIENNLSQAAFYVKLRNYVRNNHLEFYSYLISNLEKLISRV